MKPLVIRTAKEQETDKRIDVLERYLNVMLVALFSSDEKERDKAALHLKAALGEGRKEGN